MAPEVQLAIAIDSKGSLGWVELAKAAPSQVPSHGYMSYLHCCKLPSPKLLSLHKVRSCSVKLGTHVRLRFLRAMVFHVQSRELCVVLCVQSRELCVVRAVQGITMDYFNTTMDYLSKVLTYKTCSRWVQQTQWPATSQRRQQQVTQPTARQKALPRSDCTGKLIFEVSIRSTHFHFFVHINLPPWHCHK